MGEEARGEDPPWALPATKATASRRVIDVIVDRARWRIELELTNDPGIGDWVSFSDKPSSPTEEAEIREVSIRVALAHPFMERFAGTDPTDIEPLLRVAVAIVLAEITAREGGVKYAGELRRRVNELLREALSKP